MKKISVQILLIILEICAGAAVQAQTDTSATPYGFVLITSSPGGARISINGADAGQITPFQARLRVGRYQYRLIPPTDTYHPLEDSFAISQNSTTRIDAVLKPNFGNVYIRSNPSGAEILIDSIPMGATPKTVYDLKSGMHAVTLTKDEYKPLSQKFLIEDGKTTILSLDLPAGFGILAVVAAPPETEIFVDGVLKKTGFYSGQLASGNHDVEVRLDNYHSQKISFTSQEGEEKRLTFDMIPKVGSISVMVDPPETKIYLDGEYLGLSPMMIPGKFAGDYDLRLQKDGFADIEKTISVVENEVVTVPDTMHKGCNVNVTSVPLGARILLAGEMIGETPGHVILPYDTSQLIVHKRFFFDRPYTVAVDHNGQSLDFELFRATTDLAIKTNVRNVGAILKLQNTGPGETLKSKNFQFQVPAKNALPAGEYSIQLTKPRFKTLEDHFALDIGGKEISYTLVPERFRKKGAAMFFSLLFPGTGQTYLRRGGAEPLLGIVGYAALGAGIYYYYDATSTYHDYLASSFDNEREKLKNGYKESARYSKICLITAGSVWGVNMLWTMIMPGEKKRFRKLGITGYYDPDLRAGSIALVVRNPSLR